MLVNAPYARVVPGATDLVVSGIAHGRAGAKYRCVLSPQPVLAMLGDPDRIRFSIWNGTVMECCDG